MLLAAWTFALVLYPHFYDTARELGSIRLPTWELCEATRQAVLLLPMVDTGWVMARECVATPPKEKHLTPPS